MTMVKRDLFWSQYLRNQYDESVPQRLLAWLDVYDASKLTSEYGEVYITVMRWFLTTTNRAFRDKATKALYLVGRQHPQLLFNSTLDSLSLNDPYIPERMLAAAYGAVMALQFSPGSADFCCSVLSPFAKELYAQMFRRGAKHSTTHILMRDYARHIIEAALLHEPRTLTPAQIVRIRPPFSSGGIRRWGRAEDRDKAKASPGSPLHTDFLNYTLGTLVRNRNNYDFKNPAYQEVVASVLWRIYQLGYSFDEFEVIDKEIASAYWCMSSAISGILLA